MLKIVSPRLPFSCPRTATAASILTSFVLVVVVLFDVLLRFWQMNGSELKLVALVVGGVSAEQHPVNGVILVCRSALWTDQFWVLPQGGEG